MQSDHPEQFPSALKDRYRVERQLGSGATALVYAADDLKHDRRVALKVLRRELAFSLGTERFVREIAIVSRLRHQNILPVFDSGAADGVPYYVMPVVDGETLRTRLERERQLPVDAATRIAIDVADALAHAHSQGIVHRDIKPENILLDGPRAVVADFGVARAITLAGAERLTHSGVAVGTPVYMSPEQASGQRDIDARADIYALGCVLYEMLAGSVPFTGVSAQAILARKATEPMPRLRTVRETVSPKLERIVAKALARVPADRFTTAADFAEALRRVEVKESLSRPTGLLGSRRRSLILVGSAIASAIFGIGAWWISRLNASAPVQLQALAVLPLENHSGDREQEYLVQGIHDALINELRNVATLRVTARTSVMHYRNSPRARSTIADSLQVDALIEGSVRRTDDSVYVRLRLIEDGRERPLKKREFASTVMNLDGLVKEAAREILAQTNIPLTPQDRARLESVRVTNRDAKEAFLKGADHSTSFTPDGFTKAIHFLKEAIARDSTYSDAYVTLAYVYVMSGAGHASVPSRDESFRLARSAINEAFRLGPPSAEAHAVSGLLQLFNDLDWKGADQASSRAILASPSLPLALWTRGVYLLAKGQYADAISVYESAHRDDPLNKILTADIAVAYHRAGRQEEAIKWARKALEVDPLFPPAIWVLGAAQREKGLYDDAIKAHEQVVALNPQFRAHLAHTYAAAGRPALARRALATLHNDTKRELAVHVAIVHMALADPREALRWLDIAHREHDPWISLIRDPIFRPLHSDSAYQTLVQKLGLQADTLAGPAAAGRAGVIRR